jgi:hypothetical protein
MYSLDTLYLFGNPIVNANTALAKIENNVALLKKSLDSYFNGTSVSSSSKDTSNTNSILGTTTSTGFGLS